MIVQGKAGLDGKTFIETFSAVDAVEAKMAEVLASVRLACHEIATQSSQKPMRLDRSGFCVSLAIDNTHFERSAQGIDQTEIGRATCRERVLQYVYTRVLSMYIKKKN